MKVLGVIPARGGSKRVKNKNLRELGGKSLLAWCIEAARGAARLDRVVVSSENDEILDVARSYDASLALCRPDELATDVARGIDAVRHALDAVERESGEHFDAACVLQCTSPLTLPEDVDETIALMERTGADSAVSVVKVAHDVHPAKLKTLDGDRLVPYLEEERGRMAGHELPDVYVRNCAVYVATRDVVDSGRIIGDDCRGHVMPRERSVDINDELDLEFAAFLLARKAR